MRNVTITLYEEAYRWAKVHAAKADMSLARMLGEMLRERMVREDAYERAMAEHFAQKPWPITKGHALPRREEIHERRGVRR